MDKTVPQGVALLLGFVYETETSRKRPQCYDVIFSHRQGALAKPLTKVTIGRAAKGFTEKDFSLEPGKR